MEALRWVLVFIIGILTGIVAFIIDTCVKELFRLKYDILFNKGNIGQLEMKHGGGGG